MAQDNSVRLMYIPSNDKGKGAEKKNGKDKANTKSKSFKKSGPKETKCMIGSVVSDFEASVYLSDDEHFDGKLKPKELSDQTGEISKMFNVYDQSTHKAFPSYVILSPELEVVAKFTSDHNVAIDPMTMVGILEQLLVSPKDAKFKDTKKDLKADHEEEDPMSDSGFENESDSEVQKSIQRSEKIKEGDKLKAERAKKEAN